MGIQDIQGLLESSSLEGGAVSVDLLKIARSISQRQQPHNSNRKIRPIGNKLRLIVDAENCLDRLYGGYFSDWACGGQWNRMVQFLSLLTQAMEAGNIELSVVFNGTIENSRMNEWIAHQANVRQRVGMVLKHINTKATPPPKIWWTAPICLKTALRMALRHLGVGVMCTMDDHHQEVIAYCRESGYHGLLADDAEYAAFDPPRYFSSTHIKLTYKGSLETKEFMVEELLKFLNLTKEQMCILSSLLGNFLLPENEVQDIYRRVHATFGNKETNMQGESAVKLLAEYVRTLPPFSNFEALSKELFGSVKDRRCHIFKQSVLYYLNGTADGFLKYCATGNRNDIGNSLLENNFNNMTIKSDEGELDTSGFASETTEVEQESLQNYNLVKLKMSLSDMVTFENEPSEKNSPNVYVPNNQRPNNNVFNLASSTLSEESPTSDASRFNGVSNGSYSSNSVASPSCSTTGTRVNLLVGSESSNGSGPQSPKNSSTGNIITPVVSADVLRTSSLRHQKGLMSPWILHVLSTREVRLPCVMEDESNRDFPSIHKIYLSLRQKIYAVLFNLHHHRFVNLKKKENKEIPEDSPPPEIIVKEWVYSRSNPYQTPVEVKATPLPWAVPTLQRLWFGPSIDDKRRRMRALLSCLNSDTPLILNIAYVPQHMLVMACVLRYIMSQDKPILRRSELDVFLCQAFNPDLINTQYLQELTLSVVTSRGVQLAAIFMQGVEMALLANDACGAPLPWLMCCPWLFFDGKLFHHILTRATHAKSLLDLCENRIERVVKVERMRKAILEGLEVKFAAMPLPQFSPNPMRHQGIPPACLPTMQLPSTRGNSSTRRSVPSRGGQLQIAGVVVGQWGANYGYQGARPPVMTGNNRGGLNQGRGGHNNYPTHNYSPRGAMGRGRKPGPLSFPINRKTTANKKKGSKPKQNATNLNKANRENNGFAVKTENGEVDVPEVLKEQSGEEGVYLEERTETKTGEQGQGDGPSVEASS